MRKVLTFVLACVLFSSTTAVFAADVPLSAEIARVAGLAKGEAAKALAESAPLVERAKGSNELTCLVMLLRLNAHATLHDYPGVLEDAAAIAKTGEQLNYQKADDVALAVYEANSFQANTQIANDSLEKHVQTFGDNAHRLVTFRLRQVDLCINIIHDFDTAARVLENLRATHPQMGETIELRQVDVAVAKGDLPDAIARSRKLLEARASQLTHAEDFAIRQRLGDMLLASRQYDAARAVYTKLSADVPGPLPRAISEKGPVTLSAAEIANRKIAAGLASSDGTHDGARRGGDRTVAKMQTNGSRPALRPGD